MRRSTFGRILPALALLCAPGCGNDPAASEDTGSSGQNDASTAASPTEDSGTTTANPSTTTGPDATTSETPTTGAATETDGPDVFVCGMMTFTNVVDEAACADLQGAGIDLILADKVEMCRRLFIDLLGSSPTAVEFESQCKWRPIADIVDDFMARPDYVRINQRMWADQFHMTSAVTFYKYIEELDVLVGDLYKGTLRLKELAEVASTHPGFLGRFDGVDLVGYNFAAFLGRDALPSERLALEPLWHMWEERPGTDPFSTSAPMVVLNTIRCMGNNASDCTASLWGDETVTVAAPVPGNEDPDGPNVLPLAKLTKAQLVTLRKPGQLIAQQPNFYEAYVDRALHRYLGYSAGAELPLVRQALVDLLAETDGDVRALDREILTSVLYGMTNNYEEGEVPNEDDWDPPYWHGPLKQMDAEDWLASAAKLTGIDLGSCDHRYPVVQSGAMGFHANTYPKLPDLSPDYNFRDKAQLLGGCPDRVSQFRELRTGLIAALTQSTITEQLCAGANQNAPIYPIGLVQDPSDKSQEALAIIARDIYAAALVRPLPAGVDTALSESVDLCRDDLNCTSTAFAAETCRAILKSADFLFY